MFATKEIADREEKRAALIRALPFIIKPRDSYFILKESERIIRDVSLCFGLKLFGILKLNSFPTFS
jgi:hypothetical protein